jgi:hypothetical protein
MTIINNHIQIHFHYLIKINKHIFIQFIIIEVIFLNIYKINA